MTKTEQLSVALSLSLESENSFHFLWKVKTSQPASQSGLFHIPGMEMKRTYQTKVQKKSEEEEKKKEKLEKYRKAADDYKKCKFKNIRQAALAYDLSYVTLYKVCYSYPWQKTNIT